jgi:HSP20 family molecular chaperone IbpA
MHTILGFILSLVALSDAYRMTSTSFTPFSRLTSGMCSFSGLVRYSGAPRAILSYFSDKVKLENTEVQFDIDIFEYESVYLLKADLPGFSKEKIKIKVIRDILVISSERENVFPKAEENFENGTPSDFMGGTKTHLTRKMKVDKFCRKKSVRSCLIERKSGLFSRTLTLPEDIDDSKGISATYFNGVLELSMPKKKLTSYNFETVIRIT